MDSIGLERATVSNPTRTDLWQRLRQLALSAAMLVTAIGAAWYARDWSASVASSALAKI